MLTFRDISHLIKWSEFRVRFKPWEKINGYAECEFHTKSINISEEYIEVLDMGPKGLQHFKDTILHEFLHVLVKKELKFYSEWEDEYIVRVATNVLLTGRANDKATRAILKKKYPELQRNIAYSEKDLKEYVAFIVAKVHEVLSSVKPHKKIKI